MSRLAPVLAELRPRIPEPLLAGRGWDDLVERVGGLPAAAARWCGFEFRLGDPDPAADFFESLSQVPVRRYFVERGRRAAPGSAEAWLGDRLSGRAPTPAWISPLQVGYDIVEASATRPPAPINYLRFHAVHARRSRGFTPARLGCLLAESAGRDDHPPLDAGIARVFEALPPEARVLFAVAPPDRIPRCARLIVTGLSGRSVGGFLTRIGWPGSVSSVVRVVASLREVSHHFMAAISLGADGPLPPLGLELEPIHPDSDDSRFLAASWTRTDRSHWEGFVDRVTEMGLCLPSKARALKSWPRQRLLLAPAGTFRLFMGLNHIKVAVTGSTLAAKAYAGLSLAPAGNSS